MRNEFELIIIIIIIIPDESDGLPRDEPSRLMGLPEFLVPSASDESGSDGDLLPPVFDDEK